ncbi:MAG: hypothetical protein ACPGQL_07540 [Thermoplasmatota archaeon]
MPRLAKLLRDKLRMLKEDAQAVASVVEEAFRGEPELNDEFLDTQLRSVFYQLQDEGVLGLRRTEYELNGQARRAYFWQVNDALAPEHAPATRPEPSVRLYGRLDDQAWSRRRAYHSVLLEQDGQGRGPQGPN